MLKKLFRWCRELLFPPKCVCCGAFLKKDLLNEVDGALCENCYRSWKRSLFERCGACGLEYSRCRCKPSLIARLGVLDCVKLIPYERVRETVGKKSILVMKKRNCEALFRFFGEMLAQALRERLAELDKCAERILVTYLPRSAKGVNEYGFDQSRLLAKRIACELDADFSCVFKRKRVFFSREQKHLSASERRENVKSAFVLSRKHKPSLAQYDLVVLVDDVITTGASLAGCISLLDKEQRGKVVCLTVGATPRQKKNKIELHF